MRRVAAPRALFPWPAHGFDAFEAAQHVHENRFAAIAQRRRHGRIDAARAFRKSMRPPGAAFQFASSASLAQRGQRIRLAQPPPESNRNAHRGNVARRFLHDRRIDRSVPSSPEACSTFTNQARCRQRQQSLPGHSIPRWTLDEQRCDPPPSVRVRRSAGCAGSPPAMLNPPRVFAPVPSTTPDASPPPQLHLVSLDAW